MKIKKLSQGFTLVELLVVIAIIGILSTLLILNLNTGKARGRDAKRTTDLDQIRTAMELYFEDNSEYPATLSVLDDARYFSSGKAPKDPLTGADYHYKTSGTPITKYQIWAELENKNAGAFKGDSDINEAWSDDGTVETCASSTVDDCRFDVGVK